MDTKAPQPVQRPGLPVKPGSGLNPITVGLGAEEPPHPVLLILRMKETDLTRVRGAFDLARSVIVVGDQKQLPPIPVEAAADLTPPIPAYDCRQHNLLSSLLPRR
ncbi:hypothetical protein [Amycolatopsis alkalitolerans]|uniref:Uncharacterized protein n=1 Tax=Amycolatopsis alkalitolerans TaxID=2547244 RepID=A0A5C4LZ21_9PSEU|nr:hypothetical protein [Amycolatopsis alkalitolerans]TNC25087.1 hypothetical protein FG385_15685 [Amycolatopsis alkalitolerans]